MIDDDRPLILNHKPICCGCIHTIARLGKKNLDRPTSVFCLGVEAHEIASIYNKT